MPGSLQAFKNLVGGSGATSGTHPRTHSVDLGAVSKKETLLVVQRQVETAVVIQGGLEIPESVGSLRTPPQDSQAQARPQVTKCKHPLERASSNESSASGGTITPEPRRSVWQGWEGRSLTESGGFSQRLSVMKTSGRGKVSLSAKDRESLLRKWGEKLYKVEEEALKFFSSLENRVNGTEGHLYEEEFKKCLGAMGMISDGFPNLLFRAIDTDRSGTISFKELLQWLLVMTYGREEEKLHFGFAIADHDGDGKISKPDLTATIEEMFEVLTGLRVRSEKGDVLRFVDTVFEKLGAAESGEISWQVFSTQAKSISVYLRTLGSRSVSYHTPLGRRTGEVLVGGQKWCFILSMMLGLELAVKRVNPLDDDGLEDDMLSAGTVDHLDSTRTVDKTAYRIPTSDGTTCRFVSYGAAQFQAVRQACGISDEDFLLSVGVRQVIGSLLMGDLFGLSEQVSEGKSGSMFYWSQDGRFMIKSICKAESYSLRRMLSGYKEHMLKYPTNLLMKILGLFRLKIDGQKWDIVVLQNVFATSSGIHERFDLKGSTYERTVGPRKRGLPGVVMKDKDFIELCRKIRVEPEVAKQLKQQIQVDAQFLSKHGIIDYSLLLGVHFSDRGMPEDHWINLHSTALLEAFRAFQNVKGPLFRKDFDFETFCHYAYQHEQFEQHSEHGLIPGGSHLLHEDSNKQQQQQLQQQQGQDGSGLDWNPRRGIRGVKVDDSEPEQVFFLGIVDTLVPFDAKKKGEYMYKSITHMGGQSFSVIPPDRYAKRFAEFVCSCIC